MNDILNTNSNPEVNYSLIFIQIQSLDFVQLYITHDTA